MVSITAEDNVQEQKISDQKLVHKEAEALTLAINTQVAEMRQLQDVCVDHLMDRTNEILFALATNDFERASKIYLNGFSLMLIKNQANAVEIINNSIDKLSELLPNLTEHVNKVELLLGLIEAKATLLVQKLLKLETNNHQSLPPSLFSTKDKQAINYLLALLDRSTKLSPTEYDAKQRNVSREMAEILCQEKKYFELRAELSKYNYNILEQKTVRINK